MADDKYTFSTAGTPTFIKEYADGLFRPIAEMAWFKDTHTITPTTGIEVSGLALNQDIFEVPTRGLELIVAYPDKCCDVEHAIMEMRKLAEVAKCSHFAFEFYSCKYYCIGLGVHEGKRITKAMPRLFRKAFSN